MPRLVRRSEVRLGMTELSREYFIEAGQVNARQISDGRWIKLEPLPTGEWRLMVGFGSTGWREGYDFRDQVSAITAFTVYDGGDPETPWTMWRMPGGLCRLGPDWPEGGLE